MTTPRLVTQGEDRAAFEDIAAAGSRSTRLGRVEAFDVAQGLGVIVAEGGAAFGFHSTAIIDGSRQIAVGQPVAFVVVAAPGGRYEAASVSPIDGPTMGSTTGWRLEALERA
ncbi:MAG TPA: hypothetical protein VK217_09765 [Acidimicrobiales bacterium]|nr:hypothetical protein [Acidimicrobiales bacterium]